MIYYKTILQFWYLKAAAPNLMPNPKVAIHFHDTLTTIESLVEISKFNGEAEKFYELIEECASKRPEPSIMKLITYTSSSISPIMHMWLTKLDNLIKKYYRQENRTTIRLKVVNVLANTVKANRYVTLFYYEKNKCKSNNSKII